MRTETIQFFCDICRIEISNKEDLRSIEMFGPGATRNIYEAEHVCGPCFESTLLFISQLPKGVSHE